MNNDDIFVTLPVVLNLATIVSAAQKCAKVARVCATGDILYGHARCIGSDHGAWVSNNDNIMDSYLRVTLNNGFEAFWPVRELLTQVANGEFTEYDWS